MSMVMPYGNHSASIMLVGESPTRSEALAGKMYFGNSGQELGKMLHEAGLLMTDCYITSVCRKYMPGTNTKTKYFEKMTKMYQIPKPQVILGSKELEKEIQRIKPTLIIALGDLALYALTGELGITKWRGSILLETSTNTKVIPTYAPDVVQRKWDWRFITVQDLRRCYDEVSTREIAVPEYDFLIRPSFVDCMEWLDEVLVLAATHGVCDTFDRRQCHDTQQKITPQNGRTDPPPLILAGDIETRLGHIACFGISINKIKAICIPFICVDNEEGYWSSEEELAIVLKITELFRHPSIGWVFQNGLYDYQYFAKWWGAIPKIYMDTMLAHHTLFAGLPKGLDFLSSIYCRYHRYWKDEGKDFHKSLKDNEEENLYWVYNCKDLVTSYEIMEVLSVEIPKSKATLQYEFQMTQFYAVLRMMLRGVRVDLGKKAKLLLELTDAIVERERYLIDVIGHYVNPKSPKQMKEFFYGELSLPTQKVRKTGVITTNADALEKLSTKEPLIAPLVQVFSELRSLNVFLGTFVKAPVSEDGQMRSSYNIAGAETFRWSSSQDAFGQGMNLQNLSKGNE